MFIYTVCPRSSDPFYIVTYHIKWVTTSWIYSTTFISINKFGGCKGGRDNRNAGNFLGEVEYRVIEIHYFLRIQGLFGFSGGVDPDSRFF